MFELLLDFTGKALDTALVLFLVSQVAERLGPFMVSVLMAMPMNAGPGYFFVSLEVSPQFLSKGALMSFAATRECRCLQDYSYRQHAGSHF